MLAELGLTYESVYLNFDKNEQKAPAFTQYNPNGRIPALIDHKNGDFTVWCVSAAPPPPSAAAATRDMLTATAHRESNAIMTYLVEKYDTAHKISVAAPDDKIIQLQWLFFQGTGQG